MDFPVDNPPKTAEEFVALLKLLMENNELRYNAHAMARACKANLVYGRVYEMPDGSRFQTNRAGDWARVVKRQLGIEPRPKLKSERQRINDFLNPRLEDI